MDSYEMNYKWEYVCTLDHLVSLFALKVPQNEQENEQEKEDEIDCHLFIVKYGRQLIWALASLMQGMALVKDYEWVLNEGNIEFLFYNGVVVVRRILKKEEEEEGENSWCLLGVWR